MADFRRSIIVLAALALLLGTANAAFAQTPQTFLCTSNAGVPPLVRSEGETELTGDNVLNCLNGTSTAAGMPVPTANIQIFLNTALTSRLFDTTNSFSEALLLVDEPAGTAADPQVVCSAPPCAIPNGKGATVNPAGNIYKNGGVNVWVGKQVAANSVVFLGVPIDPPGTQNAGTARIFRFTNVRANASGLAVAAGGTSLPTQVQMIVSSSGTTSLPINNPTQVVGIVVNGLIASQDDPVAFQQCNDENIKGGKPDIPCGGFGDAGNVNIKEGFATAAKLRVNPAVTIPPGQDTPGFIYNSESGLFASGNPDSGLSTSPLTLIGVADFATRYAVTFANVPPGVSVYLPLIVSNVTVWGGGGPCLVAGVSNGGGSACVSLPTGLTTPTTPFTLQMVTSATAPDGPIGSGIQALLLVPDAGVGDECVPLGQVTLVGGTGQAIYEVVSTDPTAIESISIPVSISYVANPGAGSPGLGTATASVSFAPIIADATAEGASVAVPRFVNLSAVSNRFSVNACETNLLWPFVTTLNGYDTGIVVANTSVDPFGTSAQTGICTFYPFNSGTLPTLPSFPTPAAVKAGDSYVNLASVMFPGGFQGYVIAICEFQYAHGYGFLQGAAGTPETVVQGYIALVIPNPARSANPFPLAGAGSGEQLGF